MAGRKTSTGYKNEGDIYIKEFSTEDQDNQPSLCAFQRDLSEPQHIAYALQQPCNWSFKNEAKVSVIAFF